MSKAIKVTRSSGNVFEDLGLPDAAEELAKTDLTLEINRIIEERGLTQVAAAALMGIDQPKVSALARYRLDGFSMERLYRLLNALGRDVEIVIKPKPRGRKDATIRVRRQSDRAGVRAR